MRRLIITGFLFFACIFTNAQQTIIHYLSGTDKDHTVPWQFFCTKGMNSGKWANIAVPSNWEQQGFGGYSYGHDKVKTDEQGLYKYRFNADKSWAGKKVFIVFDGVMTDATVKINGKPAGTTHQGGFYRFEYEIGQLLRFGKTNLLEVTVDKMSANPSVNNAERNGDFWTFAGIYRPVYLKIMPATFIHRIAIDAKATGAFNMQVFAVNLQPNDKITVQLQAPGIASPVPVECRTAKLSDTAYQITAQIPSPILWNPESPNLYKAVVSVERGNTTLHQITQSFGFRTAELRLHDGFYVNNVKVIFKGVCRHSEWPETGRTLSKNISIEDVTLMKEMNMNAVRMSHYPPDEHFLDVCDSLGLFVLDELTGWQAFYDTTVGRKLVKEMVTRDVNHPSIVIWDNGNEGGFNRALDGDYSLYDPQARLVIHPWEKFNGTDNKHYPDYNYVVNAALYDQEVFFPTEFMHGLFDGGHGAGLEDFWEAMMKNPRCAGGFLWSFHDEAIMRKDKHDSLDADGNHAPDGILGPHREKEASYYTIREIWSPVQVNLAGPGKLSIENNYLYSDLDQCRFTWSTAALSLARAKPQPLDSGTFSIKGLLPGEKTIFELKNKFTSSTRELPQVLRLTVTDKWNKTIGEWSWPLSSAKEFASQAIQTGAADKIDESETDGTFSVQQGKLRFTFSTKSGMLLGVTTPNGLIPFTNESPTNGNAYTLKSFNHYSQGDTHVVEPVYEGRQPFSAKWIFQPGKPVKLEYRYTPRGGDFSGIGFYFPDSSIRSVRWVGRGPYRVWKNRLKGQQFGVWEKKYNNTVTGESWDYPEFKGYHAEFYGASFESSMGAFTIMTETPGLFLQLLHPQKAVASPNNNTYPAFPDYSIGFMNQIPPIGTKFQAADRMGPQSQTNVPMNGPVTGVLWFDFK